MWGSTFHAHWKKITTTKSAHASLMNFLNKKLAEVAQPGIKNESSK